MEINDERTHGRPSIPSLLLTPLVGPNSVPSLRFLRLLLSSNRGTHRTIHQWANRRRFYKQLRKWNPRCWPGSSPTRAPAHSIYRYLYILARLFSNRWAAAKPKLALYFRKCILLKGIDFIRMLLVFAKFGNQLYTKWCFQYSDIRNCWYRPLG